MTTVLVQVTVEDFDRFWQGFQERGYPLRRRHGSTRAEVMRHAEDEEKVTILFDWQSRERFNGFLQDPEVRESMRKGGALGPPRVTFLTPVGELDG